MGPRFEQRFVMTTRSDDETSRLVIEGDLDRSVVGEFEDAARLLFGSSTHVVVDITRATLIDSAALGAFIKLQRLAEEVGGRLRIVIGPAFQRTVFEVTGLTGHLDVTTSP